MIRLVLFIFIVLPSIAFGQFGVSFHQSNLPFLGLNYEFKNKLRPELRVGADNYLEAISLESVMTYDLSNKEDYEVYFGLGVRVNGFTGLVIPVGLNIYPLTVKQFGFHIELAPIVGDAGLLRGSWGIRYRFRKKE